MNLRVFAMVADLDNMTAVAKKLFIAHIKFFERLTKKLYIT